MNCQMIPVPSLHAFQLRSQTSQNKDCPSHYALCEILTCRNCER